MIEIINWIFGFVAGWCWLYLLREWGVLDWIVNRKRMNVIFINSKVMKRKVKPKMNYMVIE